MSKQDTSSVSQYDWEGMPSLVDLWRFQPDDDDAPDLFFATEAEACAAQQCYRIARGFHPITGETRA